MSSASLIDELLEEQRSLSAVERFARWHHPHHPEAHGTIDAPAPRPPGRYQQLLPATPPGPGQQYAFEVDLDKCSGCKACVTACHALNGLDEDESWRTVGLLVSPTPGIEPASRRLAPSTPTAAPLVQHVTTACHHCADPGCLNGCPVLAYDKDPVTGIVRHLDDQCMGCSYCVMKCPYEVPRFSTRLGIVRKCDLCSRRLAANEAPACAQACPNEAIRITLVSTRDLEARHRPDTRITGPGSGAGTAPSPRTAVAAATLQPDVRLNGFLPDSPNPALTIPTTQFRSRRGLPATAVAADRELLRLDPAHGPLVAMLVLTQAATGLLAASAVIGWVRPAVFASVAGPLLLGALALLAPGLAASVLHLGRPFKAWRAFLGWRRSWLSREIIAFQALAPLAALAALGGFATSSPAAPFAPSTPLLLALTTAAALTGLASVAASAMVYADTGRPAWTARLAFGNFFGTTLLLGATLAAALLAWLGHPAASTTASTMPERTGAVATAGATAALVALMVRTALFAWRRSELRRALADDQHPTHWNARVMVELIPWSIRARSALFVLSTGAGLCALAGLGNATPVWATISAASTVASEGLARHAWFAAGGARRMPGGPAR